MREFAAIAILVLLIAGSWLNLYYLDSLTGTLEEKLLLSQNAAEIGNMDIAEKAVTDALDLWLNADGYTHIFIRHAEIDTISDAFFELYDTLLSGESSALDAAYGKLLYHLDSVAGIEHLSLRSIL